MQDLQAAYGELISTLTAVLEADDRSAGDALHRLSNARQAILDACDVLEHKLMVAQQSSIGAEPARTAPAGIGQHGSETVASPAVASDIEAFCAQIVRQQ